MQHNPLGRARRTFNTLSGAFEIDGQAWVVRAGDFSQMTGGGLSVLTGGDSILLDFSDELLRVNLGSVTLQVAEAQAVTVAVFDALGRRVAVLHDGPLPASQAHTFTLDGADLPSGTYVVRAIGETFAASQAVTLLRWDGRRTGGFVSGLHGRGRCIPGFGFCRG